MILFLQTSKQRLDVVSERTIQMIPLQNYSLFSIWFVCLCVCVFFFIFSDTFSPSHSVVFAGTTIIFKKKKPTQSVKSMKIVSKHSGNCAFRLKIFSGLKFR